MSVADEKCAYHPPRSAAARCPECKTYYCRECITEHEGQVICASCLDERTDEDEREDQTSGLVCLAYGLLGGLLTWLFFHGIARSLIELSEPLQEQIPF